jgi:hypothetical protein
VLIEQVYEIKLKRTRHRLKQFKDSEWKARRYVDGRNLSGSVWCTPLEPTIKRDIYNMEAGPPQVWRKGLLSFTTAVSDCQRARNRLDLVGNDESRRARHYRSKLPGKPRLHKDYPGARRMEGNDATTSYYLGSIGSGI